MANDNRPTDIDIMGLASVEVKALFDTKGALTGIQVTGTSDSGDICVRNYATSLRDELPEKYARKVVNSGKRCSTSFLIRRA